MAWLLLIVSGLGAGALTTIAGAGGGLLLLLALSLASDPLTALAVTAPALLLGNAHRLYLFRRRVDRPVMRAFALGAAPAALVGAFFVVAVPPMVVQVLLVLVTALAVLRAFGRLEWTPKPGALTPVGAGIGALMGAAGGAGSLVGPVFLSAGLSGEVYVATTSAVATVMHTTRIAGYAAGGLFDAAILVDAALVAVAIVTGNLVGRRLRVLTERAPPRSIETGILVACALLGVAGLV